MNPQQIEASVRELLAPPAQGEGAHIERVTIQRAGKRRLVRVAVVREVPPAEADDGSTPIEPLTLDEIGDISRVLSGSMDESDVMGEAPYTLEVTSPGVGEPLAGYAQFRRNVGRLLDVRHTDDSRTRGRLLTVHPETYEVEGCDHPLRLEHVAHAVVEVEFSRPDGKER